ncbi:MAG: hypothetical protein FJ221_19290, partial [Lentisphaerae bacterium]|nr:hypothetical protein [Lentisphaerota bacterium]
MVHPRRDRVGDVDERRRAVYVPRRGAAFAGRGVLGRPFGLQHLRRPPGREVPPLLHRQPRHGGLGGGPADPGVRRGLVDAAQQPADRRRRGGPSRRALDAVRPAADRCRPRLRPGHRRRAERRGEARRRRAALLQDPRRGDGPVRRRGVPLRRRLGEPARPVRPPPGADGRQEPPSRRRDAALQLPHRRPLRVDRGRPLVCDREGPRRAVPDTARAQPAALRVARRPRVAARAARAGEGLCDRMGRRHTAGVREAGDAEAAGRRRPPAPAQPGGKGAGRDGVVSGPDSAFRRAAVMNMKNLAVSLVLAAMAFAASAAAEKPNVVIILADDVGYGDLSCYGAEMIRTPNLDRLAAQGRRFTNAYAPGSVCTPTRYALVTGRFCWRTHLQKGVAGSNEPLMIETNRLTIGSLAKAHGYRTAAIGKWHLGYGAAPKTDWNAPLVPGPMEIGFDVHFAVPNNHNDALRCFVEGREVAGRKPGVPFAMVKGQPIPAGLAQPRVDDLVEEALADRAVRFIDESHASPFLLYFA